jgi:PIN domain nuclease of toxin-antitoxin system
VRYLLDTSVFLLGLWSLEKMNERAREILTGGSKELYLSAASAWEIAIKSAAGRLNLPEPAGRYVPGRVALLGLQSLPITQAHALSVSELPLHHHDPFDRVLVAQARAEKMVLMTTDHVLSKYQVQTLWCAK